MGNDLGHEKLVSQLEHSQKDKKMDAFQVSRTKLRAGGNAVRVEFFPMVEQQTFTSHSGMDAQARLGAFVVGRRHSHHGENKGGNRRKNQTADPETDNTGVESEHSEVNDGSQTMHSTCWAHFRLGKSLDQTNGEQEQGHQANVQTLTEEPNMCPKNSGSTGREHSGHGEKQSEPEGPAPAVDGLGSRDSEEEPEGQEVLLPEGMASESAETKGTTRIAARHFARCAVPNPLPFQEKSKWPALGHSFRCQSGGLGSHAHGSEDRSLNLQQFLETKRKGHAHHSSRSAGKCNGCIGPGIRDAGRRLTGNSDRRRVNGARVEQRLQEPEDELTCPCGSEAPGREEDSILVNSHCWSGKYSGLPVQEPGEPRSSKLPTSSVNLPQGVQTFPVPSRGRSVCIEMEPPTTSILLLEERPGQHGECLEVELASAQVVGEPTLGNHLPGATKDLAGQGGGVGMCPALARSTVVASTTSTSKGPTLAHQEHCNFQRRKGPKHATPTLGNPFHGMYGMNLTHFKNKIREVERLQDVPTSLRREWLMGAEGRCNHPRAKNLIMVALKRLDKQGGARYPVFFSIQ